MSKVKKFYLALSILYLLTITLIVVTGIGSFIYLLSVSDKTLSQKEYSQMLSEKNLILADLKNRYKNISDDAGLVNETLPNEKEASRLISDIDLLAKKSKLEFTSVKSDTINTKKSSPDPSLLQTQKGKFSQEMPLLIEVRGSYNNYINFIKSIESYQRLVNINSLEIKRSDKEDVAPDEIVANIKLMVYLKK